MFTVEAFMNQSSMLWAFPGLVRNSLGGLICLCVSFMLFVAAGHKENPKFWTNEGGFPLWMRHGIEAGFYPLWFLLFFMNALVVAQLLKRARGGNTAAGAMLCTFFSMALHFVTTVRIILT